MPIVKTHAFSEFADLFFWDFKRMDNVNYNFQILEMLSRLKKEKNNSPLFNKSIVLQLISIIECILYDLIRRIAEHSHERIPFLDPEAITHTKSKTLDEFNAIISHIKKHNYLDVPKDGKLYVELESLRILRNRIHIQNHPKKLDKDECNIWTEANIVLAGRVLRDVVDVLISKYPRPGRTLVSISGFPNPWK
jgi:hypothetical protein